MEAILAEHALVCQERDRLRQRLGLAEARIRDISARLERYERERAEVKGRVERILSRLEGLELS